MELILYNWCWAGGGGGGWAGAVGLVNDAGAGGLERQEGLLDIGAHAIDRRCGCHGEVTVAGPG